MSVRRSAARRARALARALACASALALGAGAARAAEVPAHPVWERYLGALPPDARARAEESVRRMSPERREAVLRRFEALDESQRELLLRSANGETADPAAPTRRGEDAARSAADAIAHWQDLPDEERARIGRNARAWAEKTPAERSSLRERLRRFRALAPGAQEALVAQRFAARSPAERSAILARLRAGAADE